MLTPAAPEKIMDDFCELAHLGGCGGPIERAHIINKSRLRNAKRALAYVEKYPDIFIASICHNHNVNRDHDTKRNRAYLLRMRALKYGYTPIVQALEGLKKCFKNPPEDLRLGALLYPSEMPDDEAETA